MKTYKSRHKGCNKSRRKGCKSHNKSRRKGRNCSTKHRKHVGGVLPYLFNQKGRSNTLDKYVEGVDYEILKRGSRTNASAKKNAALKTIKNNLEKYMPKITYRADDVKYERSGVFKKLRNELKQKNLNSQPSQYNHIYKEIDPERSAKRKNMAKNEQERRKIRMNEYYKAQKEKMEARQAMTGNEIIEQSKIKLAETIKKANAQKARNIEYQNAQSKRWQAEIQRRKELDNERKFLEEPDENV